MEEPDVLASRSAVPFGLEINKAKLEVLQTFLNSGFVLVELHVRLPFRYDVLLQFLCKSFSTTHLANCSGSNVLLLS